MHCKKTKPKDIAALVSIADECFGKGYFTSEYVTNQVVKGALPLGIYIKEKLLGFSLSFHVASQENIGNSALEFPKTPIPFVLIKTIAIHPDYQDHGYGSLLLKETLSMWENASLPILYPLWNEGYHEGFIKKVKTMGFIPFAGIKKYWYHDSLKKNYHCIRCGPPPCRCSVAFYIKWPQNHQ